MELTLGNVEDDNKVAFLLGSALRNEDAEQVLAIYDDLIPRLISETRLKIIKESARCISELPEHEFNKLAINARLFSLAPGRSSMSQASWSSATPSINQDFGDDKGDLVSPDLRNSYLKHKKSYQDEDSGLDSYKHSESFGLEINDTEEESSLLENVKFREKTELVRITQTFNPPYDEVVNIDSSTGGSSIESPRSETSATQDEYSLMEEGTEMDTMSYKETPREKQYAFWDYMPTRNTPREDYDIDQYDSSSLRHQTNKEAQMDVDKRVDLGLNYCTSDKKNDDKAPLKFHNYEDKRKFSSSDRFDLLDVNGNPKTKDIINYAKIKMTPENGSVILSHGHNHSVVPSGESAGNRKRRGHKKKEETIKAEDCENYKGRLPINDLIVYITGKRVSVEANGAGDFMSKPDKAKKKQEKNKKDKASVCIKDKKKVEASLSYNGTHEVLESSSTAVSLSMHLESNGEKLSANPSQESVLKLSAEQPLIHHHKKTDPAVKLVDCSNSAKVLSKQGTPAIDFNEIDDTLDIVTKSEIVEAITIADTDTTQCEAGDVINSSTLLRENSLELTSDIKTEESFTEVKKKTKRAGSTRVASASTMPASSAKYFNGSFYHNRQRHNVSQVTSNSLSAMHSLVVSNHTHSPRDLSPSSFPALAGTPPRIDVRRNSCDGINTVALDTKNDSDRESVKSLPVTHCARAVGELSPVYIVSYATMVAAPPRCDNGNSSESSVVSASLTSAHTAGGSQLYSTACVTPEKKTTVWKGSPRERRHSIGSSPEDKAEADRPTITHRNRQKSGSQELLCRESSTMFKDSTTKMINNLQSHMKEEEHLVKGTSCAVSNDHLESKLISPPHVSSDSLPSVSQDVTKIPQTFEQRSCMEIELSNDEFVHPQVNKLVTVPNSNKNQLQASAPVNNTSTSVLEVSKKSNTNNHKSVVFLDKRYSTFPSKNLGITFGFDSGFEPVSDSTSQAVNQLPQNTKASQTQAVSASMPVNSHIPPDSGAFLASGLHVSSYSDNSQDLKNRLVQSHCNGLIIPTNNLKDESLGITVLDNRTKSCGVVVKETLDSQSLIVKSNSSASPETTLEYIKNSPSCTNPGPPSSMGVIFSPNHPPPSYCQGSSTLQAPTSFINQANPVSSDQSTKSLEMSCLQEDFFNSCIPVVYGLKIQPNKGCGTLMFIPPSVKLGASSSAVCSFLKKQWTEVNKKKKNTESFVTCQDD